MWKLQTLQPRSFPEIAKMIVHRLIHRFRGFAERDFWQIIARFLQGKIPLSGEFSGILPARKSRGCHSR